MGEERVERRLAAILAADVAGYSRLMGAEEEATLARLKAARSELVDPAIAAHRGRIVKTTGDGMLVEFASVVDAVRCAVEVQQAMAAREADWAPENRLQFRIGINLGDVLIDGSDIHGDGVNVAARLEAMAEPGGVCLSLAARDQVQDRLPLAFEDLGEQTAKNIARPVRAFRIRPGGFGPSLPGGERTPPALPDKPSIAVLPFDNMSGEAQQSHFADGISEDITTALAQVPGLFVIARTSTFAYRGVARDLRQIGRELGVRYLLEGSVRVAGERVRITSQLIDASTGAHLWAERFDRKLEDIFALQDEITLAVANEMQVKLTEGEQTRLRYATTTNMEAWKLWLQGLAHYRRIARDDQMQARRLWERALAVDPGAASIHAMLGYIYVAEARFGWTDLREEALQRAEARARDALAIDPQNADGEALLPYVEIVRGKHESGIRKLRRVAAAHPNHADLAALFASMLNWSGAPAEALAEIERAMRLSPIYPPWYEGVRGHSYRLLGRYDEAIPAFVGYRARSPGFGLVDLAIVYAEMGREEEARREAQELLRLRPTFSRGRWATTQLYRDPARLERDLAALARAGLPE